MNSGQRNRTKIGIKTVIVTNERKLLGDGYLTFAGSLLNTDGNQITESENGSDIFLEQCIGTQVA